MNKTNILFICRYNRFRSRVAEAYFNKINKNKNIKAKSAGVFKGSPLNKIQIKEAKSSGIDISGKPTGISSQLLKWQNLIVIVADDVPPILFGDNKKYGKKLIVWKVTDSKNDNKKNVEKIIKSIMLKVNQLNKELNKK